MLRLWAGGIDFLVQTTDVVARAVNAARLRSWLMVGVSTLIMFLLLAMLVRRASNTIAAQQGELREKVAQLTTLLAQNEQLHERVRRAAARTTALNERFLHRIAADLHDGSGQGLALALMRMETLAEVADGGKGFDPKGSGAEGHLGLASMRERVEILGGTFSVQSAPGRGTVIQAALPMAPSEADHG